MREAGAPGPPTLIQTVTDRQTDRQADRQADHEPDTATPRGSQLQTPEPPMPQGRGVVIPQQATGRRPQAPFEGHSPMANCNYSHRQPLISALKIAASRFTHFSCTLSHLRP